MRIINDVKSTNEPLSIEHNHNDVYVRGNVRRVTIEDEDRPPMEMWEYDEAQMEIWEYDQLIQGNSIEVPEWTDGLRKVQRRAMYDKNDRHIAECNRMHTKTKDNAWLEKRESIRANSNAIDDTKNQAGYPQIVNYPEPINF